MYYFGLGYDQTVLLLIPALLITIIAQARVSSMYRRYSAVENAYGITGAEAARKILDANGLFDVTIEETGGRLSDHYDPRSRTMRLSAETASGATIAGAAIAAHESGHAIQHARRYVPLMVRNAIAVPVNAISHLSWWLLIIGIVLIQAGRMTQGSLLFDIGVLAFAAVVVFQLVTLPVELDASHRALKQLKLCGVLTSEEVHPARKVLSAAALTYVAALATAVLNLLRLLLIREQN